MMKGLLSMDAPNAAKKLAAMGQGDDSVLLHVQPDQVPAIAQALGHAGTVNPRTGLLGFWERGGDGPGGDSGGGPGDGGGESEGGGFGNGGFGGGWDRTSTSLSADDMAARGLNGYSFGGFGDSTQDFTPNRFGLGLFGFTPGSVASPEGLLAGTYARDWALGWSPSKAAIDGFGVVTGLPAGLAATLMGYRPDDYSVVGSLGGMTPDSAPDGGPGGHGGGLGGHGGPDQTAYGTAFGDGTTPTPTSAPAASPGRQYQAYTGDFNTYGQGGEHQFFTNNSLPTFRPTPTPAPAASDASTATQALSPDQYRALLAMLSSVNGGYGR